MKKLFDNKIQKNQVLFWLISCLIAIVIMLFLGGLTRLTNSGLSIVEWKPVTGILPPFTNFDWQKEFNLYKNFPQYKKMNHLITFSEFKFIYIVEFIHRLAARITGLIFILPLCYFSYKKILPKKIRSAIILTIIIGFIQGFLGWYMVKSGLKNAPNISHFRLASHLMTAFIIFSMIFWQVCNLFFPQKKDSDLYMKFGNLKNIYYYYKILFLGIFLQIFFGGLMAGLKAGYIYNDFPLMGGYLVNPEIFGPGNPLNNGVFVQFFHRILAIIILFFSVYLNVILRYKTKISYLIIGSNVFLLFTSIQFISGILTLIYLVPVNMALFHQLNSMMLIGSLIYIINFLFHIREA